MSGYNRATRSPGSPARRAIRSTVKPSGPTSRSSSSVAAISLVISLVVLGIMLPLPWLIQRRYVLGGLKAGGGPSELSLTAFV